VAISIAPGVDGEGEIATSDGVAAADGVGATDGVGSAEELGSDGPVGWADWLGSPDGVAATDGLLEAGVDVEADGAAEPALGSEDGDSMGAGDGVAETGAEAAAGDPDPAGAAESAGWIGTTAIELLAAWESPPTTISDLPPGAPNTVSGSDWIWTGWFSVGEPGPHGSAPLGHTSTTSIVLYSYRPSAVRPIQWTFWLIGIAAPDEEPSLASATSAPLDGVA
jgi:hypothetical protein